MQLTGKKILVIGGAGFIGSHVVEELLTTDVGSVVIYDNFARGKKSNVEHLLADHLIVFNQEDSHSLDSATAS